ncbi:MAG: hypothetical protein COA53_00345 [Rhodobacteraceae bacterium]|nr:MAG: hypothetical protein COA53_00345 [Paracoccaceae bacterium]
MVHLRLVIRVFRASLCLPNHFGQRESTFVENRIILWKTRELRRTSMLFAFGDRRVLQNAKAFGSVQKKDHDCIITSK